MTCGFASYVSDKQWCNGEEGRVGGGIYKGNSGVWAFTWWNGTDLGNPCVCPQCGNPTIRIDSGHYGIVVVWDEKAAQEEAPVVCHVQGSQDARIESVEAEGVGSVEGE